MSCFSSFYLQVGQLRLDEALIMRRPPKKAARNPPKVEMNTSVVWSMTRAAWPLFSPFTLLISPSLSIISKVYLYLPTHNGSCRLIELSSFQFDAEISPESPVEKSWWLNIEKHARPLSVLARQRGGAVYLWKLLFVGALLFPRTQCPICIQL